MHARGIITLRGGGFPSPRLFLPALSWTCQDVNILKYIFCTTTKLSLVCRDVHAVFCFLRISECLRKEHFLQCFSGRFESWRMATGRRSVSGFHAITFLYPSQMLSLRPLSQGSTEHHITSQSSETKRLPRSCITLGSPSTHVLYTSPQPSETRKFKAQAPFLSPHAPNQKPPRQGGISNQIANPPATPVRV